MILFIPTPIGNLSDISQHALDELASCEVVFCEDTRVTKSLLNLLELRYSLKIQPKEFYPLHTHNVDQFLSKIKPEIFDKRCVYVSDAGMPGISDPGVWLIQYAQIHGIKYEVLSGSNAALIAAVSSGLVQKEFTFIGFLPNSGHERSLAIENLLKNPYPCVVYESPKRIVSLIEIICKFDENREIFAIKEATKKFETKFKNSASNLLKELKNANLLGEWSVVISPSLHNSFERITQNDIMELDIAPKIKAKLLSKISGESVKNLYEKLIK